ncbi:zinc finger protein 236-like [Lutzomyia longipalpis]|uniref:zinc finger protein 236-like n=1 Tax=Lutzomyia longipalpis TaxID=7200 RepID=UPI002484576F|nr:zinc finger protein 236-like [Lutzomyia longipalpis]
MERNPLEINDDDDIVFIHSTIPTRFETKLNLNLVSSDSSSASSSSEDESSSDFPDNQDPVGSPSSQHGANDDADITEECTVMEPKVELSQSPSPTAEYTDEEEKPKIRVKVKKEKDAAEEESIEATAEVKDEKTELPKKSNPLSVKMRTYNSARKEKNNVMKRSGPNKYHCQYCAKGWMHLETLERHMSKQHQDMLAENGNTCKLCKSKFRDSQLLMCHIKTHNQRFNCAVCGRRFSTQKFLDIHINMHFHEQDYPCELCHLGFSTSPELKEHYSWHEAEIN